MAKRYPQEHWASVAEVYASEPIRPAVKIAERFGVPEATARRWISHVRREGLIGETSHGRTSEYHDRVTRIAADLKVERHELAQVILRHIPSGKLYVHQSDAAPVSVPFNVSATFGAVIKEARKKRGWTQAELATNVGSALGCSIPPLAVHRTEAGTRPVPFNEVAAFAAVLNLSLDELIRAQVQPGGEQS